jgi:hypothetical protein
VGLRAWKVVGMVEMNVAILTLLLAADLLGSL